MSSVSPSKPVGTLILTPIAGAPIEPIPVASDRLVVLGRSGQSDVQLQDQVISRRHCQVGRRGETWLLTDLESRHGTFLNGIRIEANSPTPLFEGDRVRVGPWSFRVAFTSASASEVIATTDDRETGTARVKQVAPEELGVRAEARLDLLIEAAATIASAASEEELASAAVSTLVSATGFPRAAMVRLGGIGDQVQVIAFKGAAATAGPGMGTTYAGDGRTLTARADATQISGPEFSRSLLLAAAAGQVVRLGDSGAAAFGHSIMQLGIENAICAPIIVDSAPDAFLYLDSRGRDSQGAIAPDAAAFCSAIARICALAMGNIQRRSLRVRQQELEKDLNAARRAQLLITPPARGTHGTLAWSLHSQPGRYVAGDLIDVIPLPGGRLGLLVGDVSGKGVGTALLMATTQSHLSALLRAGMAVEEAVASANRTVCMYSSRQMQEAGDGAMFVSLWCGVFDPSAGRLRFVDAGHGYCLAGLAGGAAARVESGGGIPLGVSDAAEYAAEEIAFPAGSRALVFSDGVAEQTSAAGSGQFGFAGVLSAVTGGSPDDDVRSVLDALRRHAGGETFQDDVTLIAVGTG